MIKKFPICKHIIFLLIFPLFSHAQIPLRDRQPEEQKESFLDRVYIGGGFGLQFGTYTYVELAPIVGYKITEKLSAGLTGKYIFFKYKDDFNQYSTNVYGGGVFARYFILESLFLHTEYELLNLDVPDLFYQRFTRMNISSVFVGAGYRQMIGNNSYLDLMLLYNLNESTNSPYVNPIFRFGFAFGL